MSSRLPDLPNAGYATTREKELSDAVMFFLRAIERDRKLLLMMVIEGEDVFVPRYMKEHRFLQIDHDLAKAVFGYMKLLAGPDPQRQLGELLRIRPFGSKLTQEQADAMAANLPKADA